MPVPYLSISSWTLCVRQKSSIYDLKQDDFKEYFVIFLSN